MRFRNPSRDGETETGATARAGFGALASFVYAIETLEDVRLRFDRNAGASVGYGNDVVFTGPSESQRNFAPRRSVLDRVVQQIEQHLPQQILVASVGRFRSRRAFYAYALELRQHARGTRRLRAEFIEV